MNQKKNPGSVYFLLAWKFFIQLSKKSILLKENLPGLQFPPDWSALAGLLKLCLIGAKGEYLHLWKVIIKFCSKKNCLKISYQPLSIWPRWRFERYALKVLGGGLFSFLIPSRWGVYRTVNIQSWLKSKNKLDLCIRENKLYS